MPKTNKNRNIIRIDIHTETGTRETHGYQVRINRRGHLLNKFFADKKFGGKRKSLEAAREFRDEIEKEIPPYSPMERAQRLSSRNTSGFPGVSIVEKIVKKGEREYNYTVARATWCPKPGTIKTRSFSFNQYGKKEAIRLAVEARKQGLEVLMKKSAPRDVES